MLKVLGFYNHFGSGDVFNSKEFIRKVAKLIPAEEYYILHQHGEELLFDLDGFKYSKINYLCKPNRHFYFENNELYINTWIGLESKYVLPGIGCTVGNNLRLYNDILKELPIGVTGKLGIELELFIPSIQFTKLDLIGIDINEYAGSVLISNGDVFSNQAKNFNMCSVIEQLADLFTDLTFVATQKFKTSYSNIKFTNDIFNGKRPDLNYIAYLSSVTPLIVGRASGPYVFCQHFSNLMRGDKTFLAFTNHINSSIFAKDCKINAKMHWSPLTNINDVATTIASDILGIYYDI